MDLEDRSRRSNVVVFGISEDPAESEADLRRKVITDTFEKKLNVKCDSVARIHRLGKGATNRPVILYFQDYNEKTSVMKNVKKLKGTKIFIQNDYSQQTLQKRKLLWESAKADKSQGKTAFLIHDKLCVGDDLFIWNEAKNERQKYTVKPLRSPLTIWLAML